MVIGFTLMLPIMSFFTGVKATEPSKSRYSKLLILTKSTPFYDVPNNVVVDSAASRKSEVGTPLSFVGSIGMSTNDFLWVSNHVPPGGTCGADMVPVRPVSLVSCGQYRDVTTESVVISRFMLISKLLWEEGNVIDKASFRLIDHPKEARG